jgi:hypothetical protein
MKDGVEYFPLDVDFLQDDKIRLIKAEFGAKGILIVIALLCDIYRTNGYYKVWDKDACLLMADAVGCGIVPENITQVVQGCLRRSIFNDGVFQMFGILTSAGIQRRYIRAVSTRDQITIYKEYWLLNMKDKKDVPTGVLNKVIFKTVNSEETTQSLKKNPIKTEINFQSKVKESRVKKSKEDMGASAKAETPRQPPFICILLHDKTEYPVMDAQVREWESLYPAVNVKQELRKMKGWCDANPARRKTGRGIQKFINAWLSREQDKGGTYGVQQQYSSVCEKAATGIPEKSSERHGQYF